MQQLSDLTPNSATTLPSIYARILRVLNEINAYAKQYGISRTIESYLDSIGGVIISKETLNIAQPTSTL